MLFIDSSDPKEIADLWTWGCFSGITTNPSIIARDTPGRPLKDVVEEILAAAPGESPVSVQVTNRGCHEAVVEQAYDYSSWNRRIVVKVPIGPSALQLLRASGYHLRVNVTACMTTAQAMAAAYAGAAYVSIFWGRINDSGQYAGNTVKTVRNILDREGLATKIIVGSVRTPKDVEEALNWGAHVVTVKPSVLREMLRDERTDRVVQQFHDDWAANRPPEVA